jgi:hypothetical protein
MSTFARPALAATPKTLGKRSTAAAEKVPVAAPLKIDANIEVQGSRSKTAPPKRSVRTPLFFINQFL